MKYKKYPIILITDWSKVKETDFIVVQYSDGSGANKFIKLEDIHKDDRKVPNDDYSTRYYIVKDKFLFNLLNHNMHLERYFITNKINRYTEEMYTRFDEERNEFLDKFDYGKVFENKKTK